MRKFSVPTTVRITLHQETDGTYWADSPDAVGCFTVGATIDETLLNMKDAVRTHFELPARAPVQLSPTLSAKLSLT
ncbi:type II toxin-antitoxin system HicB family antitoxin [Candidatus Berkelbacteria bacterium]|nr:type II toxin-antitoxin system HicB family antitoxin [Candidatus Berkelbacteria bacterium]